jgi:hypothetical protein
MADKKLPYIKLGIALFMVCWMGFFWFLDYHTRDRYFEMPQFFVYAIVDGKAAHPYFFKDTLNRTDTLWLFTQPDATINIMGYTRDSLFAHFIYIRTPTGVHDKGYTVTGYVYRAFLHREAALIED